VTAAWPERHEWPTLPRRLSRHEVVTRRIERSPSSVRRALAARGKFLENDAALPLMPHGILRYVDGFASSDGPGRFSWEARARLYGRGPRLFRYARVVLEITARSDWECELHLRPVARRLATWGVRRQRQYFALAHQAADELVEGLVASTPDPPRVALLPPATTRPKERLTDGIDRQADQHRHAS